MTEPLHVSFVTPHCRVTFGEATTVVAPAVGGELGVLPGHVTLLAELVPGVVRLCHAGTRAECFAISGGFIEVDRDRVVLLVETAERPGEIDITRARAALASSERALAALTPSDAAYEAELAHAERARVRLRAAELGEG